MMLQLSYEAAHPAWNSRAVRRPWAQGPFLARQLHSVPLCAAQLWSWELVSVFLSWLQYFGPSGGSSSPQPSGERQSVL